MITPRDIAKMIDHSLLKQEATNQDLIDGCATAAKYHCASVCVKPCDVVKAVELLKDSDVAVGTVIGFPHGAHATETKVFEAELALKQGATELDMVLNIGKLRSKEYDYVEADIKAVSDLCHANGALCKVIFEICFLTDEDIVAACKICEKVGVDFVKTSTGYATQGGATSHALKLMRETVSEKIKTKAAYGVRCLDDVLVVRALGCARTGAGRTEEIMQDALRREKEGTLQELTEPLPPLPYDKVAGEKQGY